MEGAAATSPRPRAAPQAAGDATDWLPRVPGGVAGGAPAWAAGLNAECPSDPEASEEQRLQMAQELLDLQVAAHHQQGQQEAEIFQLRSEVLRLEARVLELELQGRRPGDPGDRRPPQLPPPDALGPSQQLPPPGSPEPPPGQESRSRGRRAPEAGLAALGRQLRGAREEAGTAGRQLAAQAAALDTCREQLRRAEAENARLQLQLKGLGQEFARRLQRCARGALEQAEQAGRVPGLPALRAFLEAALEDMRAAHRVREQQLARAARAARARLAGLSQSHEALLAAWRAPPDLEPRPPQLGPRQDQNGPGVALPERTSAPRGPEPGSWAQIRQQLQEFSLGTQAALERERARLLVRAGRAEEQLSELQDYVDQHLGRYRQEILRLRRMVGRAGPRDAAAAPAKPQRARTHSR